MCESPDNTQNMSVRVVWLSNELWREIDVLARVKGTTSSGALRLIIEEWRDIRVPRFSITEKENSRRE